MATAITTTYSPHAKAEIIQHVITQIVVEGRTTAEVLREDEGMPGQVTFYAWMNADPEASEALARAREIRAQDMMEELPEIADDVSADKDAIAKAKLRIYAREKYAEKLAPHRFGPKVDLTSGGEALKPAQMNDNRVQALVDIAIARKRKAEQPAAIDIIPEND